MEDRIQDPSEAKPLTRMHSLLQLSCRLMAIWGMVEIYRNYLYGFTQQLMGCWNTTNYGGRHTLDNSEMSRVWTTFYTAAIKNLTDAQCRTATDRRKDEYSCGTDYLSCLSDVYYY